MRCAISLLRRARYINVALIVETRTALLAGSDKTVKQLSRPDYARTATYRQLIHVATQMHCITSSVTSFSTTLCNLPVISSNLCK